MSQGTPKIILVACGRAMATSVVVARAIREALAARGLDVTTIECKTSDLPKFASRANLVVTTATVPEGLGIPVVTTLAFLTGVGSDRVVEEIVAYLA